MAAVSAFLRSKTDPSARVFVNITRRGCGSGCSYCYVEEFQAPQVLLSEQEVVSAIEATMAEPLFVNGREGTIVSFCPDTEPFKTEISTELMIKAVTLAASRGNRIQISTKEVVPLTFWKACSKLQRYYGQFVVFVSLTTFRKAATVEPFAAVPEQRLTNFAAAKADGIAACLYVKPFTKVTGSDLWFFQAAVAASRPSAVCVGMIYQSSVPAVESMGKHPAHAELSTRGVTTSLENFVAALEKSCDVPIFYTSVCVSGALASSRPRPNVRRVLPNLCTNCGNLRCLEAV